MTELDPEGAATLKNWPDGNPALRIINYVAYVCTLVGIPLTVYLYLLGVQARIPAYYVNPARVRVFDTSIPAPSQLQVLYKGKDLSADVTATTVYFWNDGKLPIKADDVLEQVTIELDPSCEILDARVLKVSRPVTKFSMGQVSGIAKNVLPVSFNILERGDGAAIQVIYLGKPDARVLVKGTVIGAPQPALLTQPAGAGEPSPGKSPWPAIVFALIPLPYVFVVLRKTPGQLKAKQWLPAVTSVLIASAILYGACYFSYIAWAMTRAPQIPGTIWR